MEKNLFKISPVSNLSSEPEPEPSMVGKNTLNLSLPFMVQSLLIGADDNLNVQLIDFLTQIKNLIVKRETAINFISSDVQVLFLVYSGNEQSILPVMEKAANQHIATILIGDNIPATLMRKAIQHNVKDIIPLDNFSHEIGASLMTLVDDIAVNIKMASVISIVNGKGGSGASFITDCLGQICAQKSNDKIVLFDGDFQHGSLADILSVEPEYYLSDALKDVDQLDALSIQSMMCTTNNLSLLPVKPYSHLADAGKINSPDLNLLMNKIRSNFDLVIADFSRGLDNYSLPIVDVSEVIFVVVQQNIVSIREAKALVTQMRTRLGIKPQRIHLIINRFSKKHSTISIDEVKDAVGIESAFIIHNNYELASACTDLGKRIEQVHNAKQIKKDIGKMVSDLIPLSVDDGKKSGGFWSRFTGNSNKE